MTQTTPRIILGDCETTGLSALAGAVEIAMLELSADMEVLGSWESLINPGVPIEPGAQAIHGISDADVRGAPTMAEAMNFIFPEGKPQVVFIAHNARFDRRFFGPYLGITSEVCTLQMARKHMPTAPNHQLSTLRRLLDCPERAAHEAMADILGVLDVLKALVPLTGRSFVQLIGMGDKPAMLYTMPFGEHKGKKITDIPLDYRNWLIQQDIDTNLKYTLETLRKARL